MLTTGTSGRQGFPDIEANFSRFAEIADWLESEGIAASAVELEQMGGAAWLRDLMSGHHPLALAAWYRRQPAETRPQELGTR